VVRYIGKRLLQIIPIFFVVSVLIFALVRMSPTEPITVILGGKQSTRRGIPRICPQRVNRETIFSLDDGNVPWRFWTKL